jgi:protein-L-isoaspartate(D-aspartate) O-methyltransferase
MSRIVAEVYAIERHESLVQQMGKTVAALHYGNVFIRQGDGTLGWPEHAPYDAIMVAAGGPEVPKALLRQLEMNGRLVIPVGDQPRVQKLQRVRRLSKNEYEYEEFGEVRFVPLVGAAGWEDE